MATPDWLRAGATLRDWDEERWVIHEVGPTWVTVGHSDRGRHRLLRGDLVEWVAEGEWTAIE